MKHEENVSHWEKFVKLCLMSLILSIFNSIISGQIRSMNQLLFIQTRDGSSQPVCLCNYTLVSGQLPQCSAFWLHITFLYGWKSCIFSKKDNFIWCQPYLESSAYLLPQPCLSHCSMSIIVLPKTIKVGLLIHCFTY